MSHPTDDLMAALRQMPPEQATTQTVAAIVRLTNHLCHLSAGNDLVAEVLDGAFKELDHRFGVIHCDSLDDLLNWPA